MSTAKSPLLEVLQALRAASERGFDNADGYWS